MHIHKFATTSPHRLDRLPRQLATGFFQCASHAAQKTMSRRQCRTKKLRQASPASVMLPVALGRMIFCNGCIMAVSIFSEKACGPGKAWQFVPGDSAVAQLQRPTSNRMNNLLQEMLFCNFMLTCETHDCRAFFEFDEVAAEPMEAWSVRAAAMAESEGWVIGHTGLVKCPKCAATALENK